MTRYMFIPHYMFILGALVYFSSVPSANASRLCLSDTEARTLVQMHKLIGLDQALMSAKAKAKGDLISAHLCQVPDGFMYRIAIIKQDGKFVKLLVDANSGQIVD